MYNLGTEPKNAYIYLCVNAVNALNEKSLQKPKKTYYCYTLLLFQMKSWITDITPRQALMVLLLANKKDTSNLVRFRPVILQGIAVNRITRASELDMEIEVIEREKLNHFTEVSLYTENLPQIQGG